MFKYSLEKLAKFALYFGGAAAMGEKKKYKISFTIHASQTKLTRRVFFSAGGAIYITKMSQISGKLES